LEVPNALHIRPAKASDLPGLASLAKRESAAPFVKWAGGKSQLLPELRKHVPERFGTYIEPFLGGGALFFDLQPSRAVLNDTNEELMNAYRVIQTDVEPLIAELSSYRYEKEFFYALRALRAQDLSPLQNAARFLYLNKSCFNGLYRVNKQGHFNVPFGRYENPQICDAPKLRRASEALKNVILESRPYREILEEYAKPGDFVYIDPPYLPVSKYSDFTRYTKEAFKEKEQIQLRDCVADLKRRGVHVMASNSYSAMTMDLYAEFQIHTVEARRSINKSASGRSSLKEAIIL
jgi:DNA adenine methylase